MPGTVNNQWFWWIIFQCSAQLLIMLEVVRIFTQVGHILLRFLRKKKSLNILDIFRLLWLHSHISVLFRGNYLFLLPADDRLQPHLVFKFLSYTKDAYVGLVMNDHRHASGWLSASPLKRILFFVIRVWNFTSAFLRTSPFTRLS